MSPRPLLPTMLLALIAGAVLAVMTDWNSMLARHSSPLFASWVAHGTGTLASLIILGLARGARRHKPAAGAGDPAGDPAGTKPPAPLWSYGGGIPGALVVVFAAITVNSPLGLAGTLALMLVGQMMFGLLADWFGLLGLPRRRPGARALIGCALVLAGSLIIIMARD